MSKPKIFIFAPVHRMGASDKAYEILEDAGGDRLWQRVVAHAPG